MPPLPPLAERVMRLSEGLVKPAALAGPSVIWKQTLVNNQNYLLILLDILLSSNGEVILSVEVDCCRVDKDILSVTTDVTRDIGSKVIKDLQMLSVRFTSRDEEVLSWRKDPLRRNLELTNGPFLLSIHNLPFELRS